MELSALERARKLERDGRRREAEEAVRGTVLRVVDALPAALGALSRAAAGAGDDDPRFRMLEFTPFRRVLLEELARRAKDRTLAIDALRRILRAAPAGNGARTLLADLLLVEERADEAERLAGEAFENVEAGARTSRLGSAIALAARGRFGGVLERAVLECVRRAGTGEPLLDEWPQLFSALMCARRYLPAFRLGEAMLDRCGGFASPQPLMWPWWRVARRAVNERRFLAAELGRIRAAGRSGELPHWFAYYRALLSGWAGSFAGARAEYRSIRGLDPVRYAWLRQAFVIVELGALDFRRAVAISRGILRHCPGHWWVRCRMAEAYLALGDRARAARAFARARETGGADARREVLTWHGEVLLWLGEYRRAWRTLDAAVRLGATSFVHGWRGAARLKLGDVDGALRDLDRAIALDPKDIEALVWRGEALRVCGRLDEAGPDIDRFIAHHPDCAWGFLNRGLLREARGDAAGMRADFARLPAGMAGLLRRRFRISGGEEPDLETMRRMMQAGLDLARGVRRWEVYVDHIWMRRLGTSRRSRRSAGRAARPD